MRIGNAHGAVAAFTHAHCGPASDAAVCQCNRRVTAALRLRRARAESLRFAEQPRSFVEARSLVRRVEQARWRSSFIEPCILALPASISLVAQSRLSTSGELSPSSRFTRQRIQGHEDLSV
jgi:hypothetical protein